MTPKTTWPAAGVDCWLAGQWSQFEKSVLGSNVKLINDLQLFLCYVSLNKSRLCNVTWQVAAYRWMIIQVIYGFCLFQVCLLLSGLGSTSDCEASSNCRTYCQHIKDNKAVEFSFLSQLLDKFRVDWVSCVMWPQHILSLISRNLMSAAAGSISITVKSVSKVNQPNMKLLPWNPIIPGLFHVPPCVRLPDYWRRFKRQQSRIIRNYSFIHVIGKTRCTEPQFTVWADCSVRK